MIPNDDNTAPIVTVGTGPVGMRVAQEVTTRNPRQHVVMYGGEPCEPYDRMRLSSVLAGETRVESIGLSLGDAARVVLHNNCPIVAIDRNARCVVDVAGRRQPYAKLVLALGSSPFVPRIAGVDLNGVLTFRDLTDTKALLARRESSRHAVVIGGGLLGLEAARGLACGNTKVTVIERAPSLMPLQLDDEAAGRLQATVAALGIDVVLNQGVQAIVGDDNVSAVELADGRRLPADTVVIAAGIRPNTQIARDSGIAIRRGIIIDDQLRTSDPNIFAVGECAEHRDTLYGLVAPGYEQAAILAGNLTGGRHAYGGSLVGTCLKAVGLPVFSMGRTGLHERRSNQVHLTHSDDAAGTYRHIVLERGKLVGAIAIGEWRELGRVQASITRGRSLRLWQRARFSRSGNIWADNLSDDITLWPATATVCQCTGVTRHTLDVARRAGCTSVDALARQTGASTVCGSCKPLLATLTGCAAPPEPATGNTALAVAAVVSALLALVFLTPLNIPYPQTVQVDWRWDALWREGLSKQITGFTLLGLGALISLIGLRKRVRRFTLGGYGAWRVVHAVIGTLAAVLLVAHTGFRPGHFLNLALTLCFVGLMTAGALFSGAVGVEHRIGPARVRRARRIGLGLHIWLLWPLPALLGFHVLKTYWF